MGQSMERFGRILHHNIDKGLLASVELKPLAGVGLRDLDGPVRGIVADQLAPHLEPFLEQMQTGTCEVS